MRRETGEERKESELKKGKQKTERNGKGEEEEGRKIREGKR